MRRLFGVPFSGNEKRLFTLTFYRKINKDTQKGIELSDHTLNLVADRASALATAISIFLAISTASFELVQSTPAKIIAAIGSLGSLLATFLVLYCLWIHWSGNAEVYTSSIKEFVQTQKLVYRRSAAFNGSLVIGAISVSVSLAALVGDLLGH